MAYLYPHDPLIKELKNYTAKFLEVYNKGEAITDEHPSLLKFEGCLENIFYCGIKAQSGLFGYGWDGSAWRWIEKTEKSEDFFDKRYPITRVIECVKERRDVTTQDGRFRLGVRYCLVKKCLHSPVEYLVSNKSSDRYYMMDAILADEILTEIFLSVLYQLNKLDFKLDLSNSAMLDLSWELPTIINIDLVPSKDLGITLEFAGSKAIILYIKPNSVAHESPDINIGDIIECINGEMVTPSTHFSSLIKPKHVQPVFVTLIKAIPKPYKNRTVYPPMLKLYKDINLDVETAFKITYVGKRGVGRRSEVKTIDKEFATFFWPTPSSTATREKHLKQEVFFEVGELGVKFSTTEAKKLIERHTYMEITACSSITLMPHYFAYIAGKGPNATQNHTCYFFATASADQVYIILQLMGQGFKRTNYAV